MPAVNEADAREIRQIVDEFRNGDPVKGQKCPACKREQVVYNGNYFCTNCDWAMGEQNRPTRIIRAYLMQRWLLAEKTSDKPEMERLGHHLLELPDATV
jgi:hypothetical protein